MDSQSQNKDEIIVVDTKKKTIKIWINADESLLTIIKRRKKFLLFGKTVESIEQFQGSGCQWYTYPGFWRIARTTEHRFNDYWDRAILERKAKKIAEK